MSFACSAASVSPSDLGSGTQLLKPKSIGLQFQAHYNISGAMALQF